VGQALKIETKHKKGTNGMFMKGLGRCKAPILLAALAVIVFVQAFCQGSPGAGQTTPGKSVATKPQKGNGPVTPQSVAPKAQDRQLFVYYFHGKARCPTCFKLESLAKAEVEADFPDAIKNGALKWETVNTEEKGNEHYEDDYKLYAQSVVISIREGGKESSWKNLDKVWQLIHDETTYRDYIKSEVAACLDGKCL
jgi:hypothetical protein